MRRPSCARTSSMSISRGFSSAAMIALRVISWNVMRRTGTLGSSTSSRCQLMASPSRSSSVASRISSACFRSFFSSATCARLSGETM
jgi:hypothetical protein